MSSLPLDALNAAKGVRSETSLIGAAGEHYVMAELLRRGFIAALAPQGVPNMDIVVTDATGAQLCAVQHLGVCVDGPRRAVEVVTIALEVDCRAPRSSGPGSDPVEIGLELGQLVHGADELDGSTPVAGGAEIVILIIHGIMPQQEHESGQKKDLS